MENLPSEKSSQNVAPAGSPVSGAVPTPAKKPDVVARQYAFGVIMALAVTASFMAGIFIGDLRRTEAKPAAAVADGKVLNKDAKPDFETHDVDFNAFWDIWKTVKARHVGEPASDVKMYYGAIAGMVASLGDPYTVFFDPDYAQKFNKELSGEFEGIGAEIGIKNNELTVIAPLPNSPAAKAGVMAGDRIIAIDGKDSTAMVVDEAVSLIRGAKGTKVKLLVVHEGTRTPKEIEITRAKIVAESVTWKVEKFGDKKVAHITISHFNDKTSAKFAEAVRSVLLEDPAGVVLDLRNNPGGYLDAAVSVAGEWINHDVVVTEKFGDGTPARPYLSEGLSRLADVPTVVLINGGSASASEIVAGALQDDGKAKLIGEKSFGKGSVQDYSEFADGSALKLTVALWYTPKDHNINHDGIKPDIEVKLGPDDFNSNNDPQYSKAVETLTGFVVPVNPTVKKVDDSKTDAPKPAPKK
jgi:carboxyl-terminal processing protease